MNNSAKILSVIALLSLLLVTGWGCSGKDISGGIFMSTDQGETWEQKVFVRQDNKDTVTISELNINKIIQDFLNPNSFFIATSTAGIYLTDNRGESWQSIGLSGNITDMVIDPTNSQTIVAAQGPIIYKTHEQFSQIDNIYTNPDGSSIVTVLIDKYNPSRYFAASKKGQVIVSIDGGITWSTQYQFNEELNKIYQAESDSRVMYALTSKGLYRSTDAGADWENLNEYLNDFRNAKKVHQLFVDPANHNHIFIATDYGLLQSLNGGNTFAPIKTLVPFSEIPIKVFTANPQNTQQMYFSVGNTVHRSTDGGVNWKTIETLPSRRNISYFLVDRNNTNTIFLGVKSVK
ncbi:hypothetical protein KKI23_02280 [Patescibacteria group bacterium]|nr:hypothetical protein [Patescibacteria group bacterium]